MEISRAFEIIYSLSEGKDPYSGLDLPANGPYHQGDTIRALTIALEGIKALEFKIKRTSERPGNSGKPWGDEEDRELIKAYKCGHPIHEMAKKHQRTEGAITSRLIKLGVIRISPHVVK